MTEIEQKIKICERCKRVGLETICVGIPDNDRRRKVTLMGIPGRYIIYGGSIGDCKNGNGKFGDVSKALRFESEVKGLMEESYYDPKLVIFDMKDVEIVK